LDVALHPVEGAILEAAEQPLAAGVMETLKSSAPAATGPVVSPLTVAAHTAHRAWAAVASVPL
jgi:hypothetical protein